MSRPASGDRVVVVGAGIVGIACAHYLHKAGYNVTVIDKRVVAGECSHANCGYVCPSHVLPLTEPAAIGVALRSLWNPRSPFRVKPRLSLSLANWMWQFTRRCNTRQMLAAGRHLQALLESSMHEFRSIVETEKFDCQWRNDGLLYVLRSEEAMHEFAKTDEFVSENFGIAARRIEGSDLPKFDPALQEGLAGAFLYECDSSVRPDALSSEWVGRLREFGVTFIEHCELNEVVFENGTVNHLATSQGDLEADSFVFAMGAWSAHWSKQLGCSLPVEPGKGYSITMDRPEPCPKYPMLFPEHRVGMTPFDDGYRLGSMMEFVGFDSSVPPARIEQLREAAEPYLLAPHTEDVHETWYGWRPMTWDSLPIIGHVPGLPNAMLATGHNMLGLSLASATGKLVAELMNEERPHIDAEPFSPRRFGGQRKPAGRQVAAVN